MSAWRRRPASLAWLALLLAQVSEGVHITELRVPAVVEHDTNSTAILDCVYELADGDVNLLIVKWYFGSERHQVYQWGKGLPPSDSGVLKGRVHLGHVASTEPLMKHRALSVANPTVELSGEYICKVISDTGTVTESKKMIVYAPAKTMNLTQDKPSPSSVNVTCLVEGVYPAPRLDVFAKQEGKDNGRRLLGNTVLRTTTTEDGLFDAVAHTVVDDASLEGKTIFECVMSVPDTQYSQRKFISYYSGATPAASTGNAAERLAAASTAVVAAGLLVIAAVTR